MSTDVRRNIHPTLIEDRPIQYGPSRGSDWIGRLTLGEFNVLDRLRLFNWPSVTMVALAGMLGDSYESTARKVWRLKYVGLLVEIPQGRERQLVMATELGLREYALADRILLDDDYRAAVVAGLQVEEGNENGLAS
jgi:hypothetical protein